MSPTIRLALPSETDDVLDFLRTVYYRDEPLRNSIEPQIIAEEDEEFIMANLQYGTCIVVEDSRANDDFYGQEIVAALIAGPKYSVESDHLIQLSNIVQTPKWAQILKLLAYLELRANVFQRYQVEKGIHCHAFVVSEHFRGKALANKMLQKFLEISFKLGYEVATMDCTSNYAINICENLNMECMFTLQYADYCDDNGTQVFFPPAPHKTIKTFAQRL